ncbi:MAG: hypothetical protein IKR57_01815 [Bacilli bacterium]|nr:hypothetical protein [Bacilli bacterium]
MKKIKLLVIFFFAIFFAIFIYKYTYNESKNVLLLGENIKIDASSYKLKKYLYNNITYKELIKCIKNDEKIVMKNKNISLNELIASSDYLILNVNNVEYLKKCNDLKINNYYKSNILKEKELLLKLLKKITTAKIIIIDNTCEKKEYNTYKVIDFT